MSTLQIKRTEFNMKQFFRALLTLALPIALQNLLATTASMVDTIMIGTQGELAVAAVGICSQISSLFFSCYFGFAGGALLFFAQYWGAEDEAGISRTFGLSLIPLLLVSLAFGGVAVFAPRFLLSIYTDKENLIDIALPYIRIAGLSYPLVVLNSIISFLMRSTERVKPPLICSVVALAVNFCINWLLINGNLGCPKLGPTGAAIGTLVSTAVNSVLLLIFLLRSKTGVRLNLKQMFDFSGGFVRNYFIKCLPVICNEFLYGVGQMLINVVIGRQIESAIAAMATFRVLEGFVFAFFAGLADASSVVIGNEVGAGNHMNAYRYLKGFAIICPAITFLIVLTFFCANGPLLGLFGLGAEALAFGKYMLLIYMAAGTIRTCNYIMNICYRAGGDTVFGTVLEISSLFLISVPATWAAGMVWQLPFIAVFSFVYTDEILRLVVEIFRTRSCKWLKPVTPQGQATLEAFHEELKQLRSKKR